MTSRKFATYRENCQTMSVTSGNLALKKLVTFEGLELWWFLIKAFILAMNLSWTERTSLIISQVHLMLKPMGGQQ